MTSPLSHALRHARGRFSAAAAMLAAMALVLVSLSPVPSAVAQEDHSGKPKPTVVLVHGAWADASSWSGVITRLQHDGYQVAAIPNHLRSLSGDAASVRAYLETLTGPIVLVAHSYGGAVITSAATGNRNIKALVFVNAFAPDAGEDVTKLVGPDSALSVPDPTKVFDLVPATLPPTPDTELYLKRATVFAAFADGLRADDRALVAAIQRPATLRALNEPSGTPAWRTIPSWYVLGTKDKIIPPGVQRSMAERAGSKITEFNEGHVGLMSDPKTVTRVIEQADRATVH